MARQKTNGQSMSIPGWDHLYTYQRFRIHEHMVEYLCKEYQLIQAEPVLLCYAQREMEKLESIKQAIIFHHSAIADSVGGYWSFEGLSSCNEVLTSLNLAVDSVHYLSAV